MSNVNNVLEEAQIASRAHFSTADSAWRLKQLHGLYRLIVDTRDELIASLGEERAEFKSAALELEVALLVQDIHSHIAGLSSSSPANIESTHLGRLEVVHRPVGVSLIVCGPHVSLRYLLGSLASSIAAGNVTVLATAAGKDDGTVSTLRRAWSTYLDPDSLFLLPSPDLASIDLSLADRIAIFDKSSQPYLDVLKSPNATYVSISAGLNIAVLDQGIKAWSRVAADLLHADRVQVEDADRLNAVFVLKTDADELQHAFASSPGNTALTIEDVTASSGDWNLSAALERARAASHLLVVVVDSYDRSIDLLTSLHDVSIQQIAVLGPRTEKLAAYIQKWVGARVYARGFVYPRALPVSGSETLFPTTLFSTPSVIAHRQPATLPSSTKALRAFYEKLILPLPAEPRGERIGFFDQVGYLVKGVGLTAAILSVSALAFGVRRVWSK